jgi:hypothetical protein
MLIDVFHSDPFTTIQMTSVVEKIPYLPDGIRSLNIFEFEPVRTKATAIEERDGVLTVIKTSPRGAPAVERVTEKRIARYFENSRIRHGDTLYADEIASIREFGSETEVMMAQKEIARRVSGPTGLLSNFEYTFENMALGAIQGVVLDADGSTIYNWYDEFGITVPTEVGFDLAANLPNTLKPLCNGIIRAMKRAAQGAFRNSTRIVGLCGDEFWDQLTTHQDVTRTYYNWEAAKELRNDVGSPFTGMVFGDIEWINYRGSDDGSTIAIPTDKVKFFPVGAPGIFKESYSYGESFDWVNTLGKRYYLQPIFDLQRNEWWRVEASSYPLFICTRPAVLQSGRAEA